jgi:hypothetical protein
MKPLTKTPTPTADENISRKKVKVIQKQNLQDPTQRKDLPDFWATSWSSFVIPTG